MFAVFVTDFVLGAFFLFQSKKKQSGQNLRNLDLAGDGYHPLVVSLSVHQGTIGF